MKSDFLNKVNKARQLISPKDQKKLFLLALIQVAVGVLDLLAIGLTSIIGSLAVTGISSRPPISSVSNLLEMLGINNLTFQNQVKVLGLAITTLLVLKSFVSMTITKKSLNFLSLRSAGISSKLIEKLFHQELSFIQSESTQKFAYTVTNGVSAVTVGILGTLLALIADLSLFIILSVGLFVVDPAIAFTCLFIFSALAIYLFLAMHRKAKELGELQAAYEISTDEKIYEGILTYREMYVRNTQEYYVSILKEIRFNLARVQATLSFMPLISKYVVEITIVLGAVSVSAYQFGTKDAIHAVSALAVFLTAGSRIAPAALRIQQSAIQIKSTIGISGPTFELIENLMLSPQSANTDIHVNSVELSEDTVVSLQNVSFKFQDGSHDVFHGINLEVKRGQLVAISGPSGAGKTTLADIILGVKNPTSGYSLIFGKSPQMIYRSHPGFVAYVPQEVKIFEGDFRSNIALGMKVTDFTDDQYWEALLSAQLHEFVSSLPDGLSTKVGSLGARLSGGQKQRLGIARALITKPKLLVLDEATSALDNLTEFELTKSLRELRGNVTIIVIAHRLSTIKDADEIIYLDNQNSFSRGTFEHLVTKIPNFGNTLQ